jgi:ubiquinone biosynthesis protein
LSLELDFRVEANNMEKMRQNLAEFTGIVIPVVYKELSTGKVLTLERLHGVRVNDLAAMDAAGISRREVVDAGVRAFFKSIMVDGLFHGDLHGGNLFVLEGNRLGIIDFGMVGRLSERSRDQLVNMVLALVNEDFENLCYQYAELGGAYGGIDFEAFQRDLRNALSPYLGLALQDVNTGRVLIEATKIAAKYQVAVPGDWMLVFKAIVTVEGMGRTLDPDFNIMDYANELIRDLISRQYSKERMTRELMWLAKDGMSLVQTLPRQIRWMFRKFNSNDFAIESASPEFKHIRRAIEVTGKRISAGLVLAALILSFPSLVSTANQFSEISLNQVWIWIWAVLFGALILRVFR